MTHPDYISIGKFAGTHGVKGELVLKHALGKKTSLKGLTTIFISEGTGSYLPWFIESTKIKSETEVFVKLESLTTKEDARPLVQKEVWITQSDLEKYAAKTSAISLLGYMVVENEVALGTIKEVIEPPHQVLCRIEMNGKEVFIPLHGQTLLKVDQKNKKVFVQLPEGLLDIYLA